MILIPRPPPPAVAFTITGKPIRSTTAEASFTSSALTSMPVNMGRPAFCMAARAVSLSPIKRMSADVGPIKTTPHFSHTLANSPFSARKPYPGWIASALVISAALRIRGIER